MKEGETRMKVKTRRIGILGALLALLLLGITSASAFAATAEEISVLPTLDSLNRTEGTLSNGGKWQAVNWANSTSGHKTGTDTTGGWGSYDAYPTINGAYWSAQ
jgi:hypothetical protein